VDGTFEPTILKKNADQDDVEWADRSAYWQQQATWKPRGAKDKRKVLSPLILGDHGVRRRIDGGSLLVQNGFTHYPQKREEWRFFQGHPDLPTRIVVVDGDGALTFDVLKWLSTQQIPLIQINWRGEAITVAGGNGYVVDFELVRAQRAAAQADETRRMAICRWLVEQKIARTLETLREAVPDSPAREIALREADASLREMRECPPQSIDVLHGIEGRVAQMYFRSWRPIPLKWKGRKPISEEWRGIGPRVSPKSGTNRDATHPVNAVLNYGYAVLESQVRIAILSAGLDPLVGYLHGRYGGKQTLVLDLLELMRSAAVDRVVLEFAQTHTFSAGDVTLRDDGVCRLNPQLARSVVGSVVGKVVVSEAISNV
jgi:CRISP-associated protein Cas1